MVVRIGSNSSSLLVQRNLADASSRLSQSYERLSSGQRINKASDDAAGLAIASALNVAARVKGQGIRNLNDALNITTIASAALNSCQEISFRQRELASQAANGTYSATQRAALANEVQKLTDEYNRIIETTSFNGRRVFGDPSQSIVLQAGGAGIDNTLAMRLGEKLSTGNAGTGSSEAVTGGSYFNIGAPAQAYHVWFKVGGVGTDPAVPGTGIQVNLTTAQAQDAAAIASAVSTALTATGNFTAVTTSSGVLQVTNVAVGNVSDAGTGTSGAALTVTRQGTSPVNVNIGGSPTSVASTDFNGDGKADFVVTTDSGFFSVYESNGDGSFGLDNNYLSGVSQYAAATGDFDNNGAMDFVVSYYGISSLVVGLNTGGAFSFPGPTFAGNPWDIATGDINRDGRADIVALDQSMHQVNVFTSDGDGSFTQVGNVNVDPFTNSIATGDFDGDGALDFIAGYYGLDGYYGNRTMGRVFMSNGSGGFGTSDISIDGGFNSITTGDVNRDGRDDIITVSADAHVNVYMSTGGGTFAAGTAYNLAWSGGSVKTGDFNGDGALDLIAGGGVQAAVMYNNGSGGFGAAAYYGTGSGVTDLDTGDFNADGKDDFIVAHNGAARAVIYTSNASGTFTSQSESVSVDFNAIFAQAPPYISNVDISTAAAARSAMSEIDTRLERISGELGGIGAFESRLQTALQVLSASQENFQAAAARITDLDVASETAKMTQAQILQQAGSAVLAQANSLPQIALKLLEGG